MPASVETQSLIQNEMPQYRMRQVDRIRIQSSPQEAWPVIRGLDTYELPISRFLFGLRTLPEKIIQILRGQKFEASRHSRIEDFTGPGKGFQILAEKPGQEIVIGSIGQFWKWNIQYAHTQPSDFASFKKPGFGKLAWNLRLDPDSQGGSWLTWELRVDATDDPSWKSFQKYWWIIGNFSHALRRMALAQFERKLGARDEEDLKLPGDLILTSPRFQKTMSKIIEATPQKVWPWLVQMGCQRAGWYSVDLLDNGGIKSSTEIIPKFQNIKVGDVLPWKPEGQEGFAVLAIEKNKSLILGSPSLLKSSKGKFNRKNPIVDTWAFVLEPAGPDATNLITRVRGEVQPGKSKKLLTFFLGIAHSIMEAAQLKNLKDRAENYA